MCLELIAVPAAPDRVSAKRLSTVSGLAVRKTDRPIKGALHFALDPGCSCSLLAESADWNQATWDLAPAVLELWDSTSQAQEPPFAALLANHVPGYPETVGLPVQMRLTGPTTRPALAFEPAERHPLALEYRAGVSVHRVMDWLKAMGFKE